MPPTGTSLARPLRTALTLRRAGRFAEAERAYRGILAQHPDCFDALLGRGVALMRLGRYREAAESYSAALGIDAGHVETRVSRANAFLYLGQHEAALADYDSALAVEPDCLDAVVNRGSTLLALGRLHESLAAFEQAATMQQTPSANLHYNRANVLRAMGRMAEAMAGFDAALGCDPRHAGALNNKGNLLRDLRRWDEALNCYSAALAVAPSNPELINNCGIVQLQLGQTHQALARFEKALAVAPRHLDAHTNLGATLWKLGRHEDALAAYARALALKPDHAEAHWNESLGRLALGDFARGWEKFEWRWKSKSHFDKARAYGQAQWSGSEPLAGRTILIYAEQGFGDTVQFARYVPRLVERGARVLFEVQPELSALLAQMAGPSLSILARGESVPPFDCHSALLSLPRAFGTLPTTIPGETPYLAAEAGRVARWSARLGPASRPRIGLVWRGSATHKNDHNRSMSLERLTPILQTPGSEIVSLQKDVRPSERDFLEQHGARDLGPSLDDFADTAAVIAQLDLVIAVDTAVAHVAGALGKPAWILLSTDSDWRWMLDRTDSPWYPNARLFRQRRLGDWGDVVTQVLAALD